MAAAAAPTTRPGQQQRAGIYNQADEAPRAPAPQAAAPQDTDQLIDSMLSQVVISLDRTAQRYAAGASDPARNRLERMLIMAEGIERLKGQLKGEVMKKIMSLMNSDLGFRCDRPNNKEPRPYSEDEVRNAVVVGLLSGVYPLFNELNIIAGRAYITKEGYQRKLRELRGLSDLVLSPGVPYAHNGQTAVRFAANWKYHGVPGSLVDGEGKPGLPIAVTIHSSTGVDAIVGKATRKALKRIYEQITGSEQTAGDDDAEALIDVGAQVVAPPSRSGAAAGSSGPDQVAQRLAEGELPAEDLARAAAGVG